MATFETAWKPSDGPARYADGETLVQLGDRIELRGWFRRRRGTVNHVPGLCAPHSELEHGGLFALGLILDDGVVTDGLIDPDTGCVLARVVFLDRGPTESVEPPPAAPWD